MIRLNTDQMKKRLDESFDFIYSIEHRNEENIKVENNERRENTQVSNG